jgi:hypothetical protein
VEVQECLRHRGCQAEPRSDHGHQGDHGKGWSPPFMPFLSFSPLGHEDPRDNPEVFCEDILNGFPVSNRKLVQA